MGSVTEEALRQQQTTLPNTPQAQTPVVGPTGEEYMPPAPEWMNPQKIGRFAAEMGGSAALTALAPQVGLPLQAARLLGPAAVRVIGQTLPKIFGSGAGAGGGSIAAETFDPTEQPLETAKEASELGLMGEAVGRGVGAGVRKLTSVELQPGALQAQRLLAPKGASLTSAQATKSRMLDVAENISEAGLVRTPTQTLKEKSQQSANELLQDILNQYSSRGTAKDVGGEIQSAIKQRIDSWRAQGHALYDQLDQMLQTQPVYVDITGIKAEAQRLGGEHVLKDTQTDALIKQIVGSVPDQVPFGTAQRLRSELLAVTGDPTALMRGRRENVAKLLSNQVDAAMEQAARPLNPQALAQWRKANAFWKGQQGGMGVGMLNDPVITQIMEKDPGVVLDVLLRSGRTEGFVQTMRMLPQPVADGVRREFLERAVSAAKQTVEGRPETYVSGAKLADKLGLEQVYGKESTAFQGLFGNQAQEIKDVVQTLRLTQASPIDQGYTFVVRGTQIGGLMAMTQGIGRSVSPVIIMAPHIAAWAINNPVSRKLIIRANNLPAGTPAALAAATKFIQLAEQNGIPLAGGADPFYMRSTVKSSQLPQPPQTAISQAPPSFQR